MMCCVVVVVAVLLVVCVCSSRTMGGSMHQPGATKTIVHVKLNEIEGTTTGR